MLGHRRRCAIWRLHPRRAVRWRILLKFRGFRERGRPRWAHPRQRWTLCQCGTERGHGQRAATAVQAGALVEPLLLLDEGVHPISKGVQPRHVRERLRVVLDEPGYR